jgi:hypothetical protein
MIEVTDVCNAPELAQDYTIQRSAGSWVDGVWQSATTDVAGFGVISVAKPKDLQMIPEGDKITSAMVFHSELPIYTTHENGDGQGGSSDILIWRGNRFRVIQVAEYVDYGFFRAIATRLDAAGTQDA